MTTTETKQPEAGPETNALVAEAIGWVPRKACSRGDTEWCAGKNEQSPYCMHHGLKWDDCPQRIDEPTPPFSTDNGAATGLPLEWLKKHPHVVFPKIQWLDDQYRASCFIWWKLYAAKADTLPLAIARAVLLVAEASKGEA